MVAGVEIVGILLGSLPLLLAALEFYGKGIRAAIRFKRYHAGLASLANNLRGFVARFRNNMTLLLTGLVHGPELERCINSGGKLWKDLRVEKKLRQRLAPNDDAYFGLVEEVDRTI